MSSMIEKLQEFMKKSQPVAVEFVVHPIDMVGLDLVLPHRKGVVFALWSAPLVEDPEVKPGRVKVVMSDGETKDLPLWFDSPIHKSPTPEETP